MSNSSSRLRRRNWPRRLAVTIAGAITLAAIGWWFARDWLKDEALRVVRNRLATSGIHVEWESADYSPLRGLVIDNVTCYRDSGSSNRLFTCGNIGIDLGWSQLLRDRSLKSWEVQVTISDAPFVAFDQGTPVLTLSKTSLNSVVTAERLEIERLEGLLNGLQLTLDGKVLFPKSSQAESEGRETGGTPQMTSTKLDIDLSALNQVNKWATFTSKGNDPELQASLHYDPADPEDKFTAKGRLTGKDFTWRTTDIDETDITFSFGLKENKLTLSDLHFAYLGKPIKAHQITYSFVGQRVLIDTLTSHADLISLSRSIVPDGMGSLSSVRLPHPPAVRISGTLNVEDFQASELDLVVEEANELTVFTPESPALSLSNLSGRVTMRAETFGTEDLSVEALGAVVSYNGRANVFDKDASLVDGEVSITGLSISRLLKQLNNESKLAGKLNSTFTVTAGRTFDSVGASGSVGLDSEEFDANVPYRLERGLLESDGATFKPKDGGTASFAGIVDLNQRPIIATGQTRIDDMPMATIFRLAGSERSMDGKLTTSYGGVLSPDTSRLTGKGSVSITDGHLYHVPVLGAVEALIERVVPNFTRAKKENLRGNFTAKNGIIQTNDLSVVSDATRIDVAGSFNLPEKTTEFTATANLDGIAGLPTLLMSKLLEIRGTGALTEPRLTMKNVPIEMASGAVKTAAGAGKATVDIVGKVGQSGTEVVTKGVGRVGDGVKKIGDGLNKLNPLSIKRRSESP